MNLQDFIEPDLSNRLCLMLLHSLWQVAALFLLALGIDRLLPTRSVQRSYNLHVIALLAALAAMPITFSLTESDTSPTSSALKLLQNETPSALATTTDNISIPIDSIESNLSTAPTPTPVPASDIVVLTPTAAHSRWQQSAPWIVALYTIGVLIMLLRLARAMTRTNRLSSQSQRIQNGQLADTLHTLSQQWSLRIAPMLAETQELVVPKVVGLIRPMILLPTAAIAGLSTGELEMILTHELAHIRRHDMWVNLVQRLAEALLFFNPTLWYLSRRISTLREYCCDELTCNTLSATNAEPQLRYAQALLRVVELAKPSATSQHDLAALAAAGRSPSELRRRVARLFGEPIREPMRITRNGTLLALSLALLLICGPAIWPTNAQTDTEKNKTGRTLQFPTDRAIGAVYSRPAATSGFGVGDDWYKDWQHVSIAQGKVSVPADHHVRLDVNKTAAKDLTFLSSLQSAAIEWLRLRGTEVNDQQFEHIGHLTGLRMLDLEQTKITGTGFKHLTGLQQLQRLDLSAFDVHHQGFGVGDGAMAVVAQLPSLESIALRLTKVTDAGMDELAKCESLKSIGIEGTNVTDAGLVHLAKLPKLEILSLGVYGEGTNVTDEGMETIGQMTQLKHLSLSSTPITNEGLLKLSGLVNLESLNLSITEVTEEGLVHLQSLKNLQSIRMFDNLRDEGAKHLSKIPNLKNINGNLDVTDIGVADLAKLPKLEKLMLTDEGISDDSLEHIAGMPALKVLWFQDCMISDDGLALLRENPTLEHLLIHNTYMTTASLPHIATLANLKSLDLDLKQVEGLPLDWSALNQFTQIEDLGLEGKSFRSSDLVHIKDLHQLTRLTFFDTEPINDSGIVNLRNFHQLKNLRIQSSTITDEGIQSLADLQQLEYLTISCLISDEGLQVLNNLKSLRNLQIASPYITEEGIAQLSKSLPSLQQVNHFDYRFNGSHVSLSQNDSYWREGEQEERIVKDLLEGQKPPKLHVDRWINVSAIPSEKNSKTFRPQLLEDYPGNVILVHFWGTWNSNIVNKLPTLKELYKKYHNDGLEIISVHTSHHADEVDAVVANHQLPWPIFVDDGENTFSTWHADHLPDYYLIDRNGILRYADIHEEHLAEATVALLNESDNTPDPQTPTKKPTSSSTKKSKAKPLPVKQIADAHAIGNRFIVCPVTTDLQRRLLSSTLSPENETSVCVFVNTHDFQSPEDLHPQTSGINELVKLLLEHSLDDNREIHFRFLATLNKDLNSTEINKRTQAMGSVLIQLAKETGFENTRMTSTIGANDDWQDYIDTARLKSERAKIKETTQISDWVKITPATTFLSKLLTNANYVADFGLVVRDEENVRFRADVLPAVSKAVEKLETEPKGKFLIRIRYTKDAESEIYDWINDQSNREQYAKQLGFERCNVSMTVIQETKDDDEEPSESKLLKLKRILNNLANDKDSTFIHVSERVAQDQNWLKLPSDFSTAPREANPLNNNSISRYQISSKKMFLETFHNHFDREAKYQSTFASVIEGLERDPYGPQIDFDNFWFNSLGNQVSLYLVPADADDGHFLLAWSLKNIQQAEFVVDKIMKKDSNAQPARFENTPYTFWTLSEDDSKQKNAVCVAHGHLLISNRLDILSKVLNSQPQSAVISNTANKSNDAVTLDLKLFKSDKLNHLQKLVEQQQALYDHHLALQKVAQPGGEAATVSLILKDLRIAQANLAQAQGKLDDAIKFYEQAVAAAETHVEAKQAVFNAGRITDDKLIKAKKQLTVARMFLLEMQEKQAQAANSGKRIDPASTPTTMTSVSVPNPEKISYLREMVTFHLEIYKKVSALNRVGAQGGESDVLAQVRSQYLMSQAELEKAIATQAESLKQYDQAIKAAQQAVEHYNNLVQATEKEVEAVEAVYNSGRVTIDVLLEAGKRRLNAKLAYSEAQARHRQLKSKYEAAKPQKAPNKENEPEDDKKKTGSALLQDIRKASAPLLAKLASDHGYTLTDEQVLHRVARPFPPLRMQYYRVGHASQAKSIPKGPVAMQFRWTEEGLKNWGMTFSGSDAAGYSLKGVVNAITGIKGQSIEGSEELVELTIPGDWVYRENVEQADMLRALQDILQNELALDIRLNLRQVERPVFVAKGKYKHTPLPGEEANGTLNLTDETITTDRVHIFGKDFVPDSGAGGGTGEFPQFLQWLGRWIDTPIINEIEVDPTRQISWRQHEPSPFTDQMRKDAHDPQRVLENITKQTQLQFVKENRPVTILFIEPSKITRY